MIADQPFPAACPPSQAQLVADLRDRLTAVGFSMARLCARAGVSHTTPARWETGATSLRWDLYQRLHSALLEIEAESAVGETPASRGSGGDFAPLSPAATHLAGAEPSSVPAAFSGEGAGGALRGAAS